LRYRNTSNYDETQIIIGCNYMRSQCVAELTLVRERAITKSHKYKYRYCSHAIVVSWESANLIGPLIVVYPLLVEFHLNTNANAAI